MALDYTFGNIMNTRIILFIILSIFGSLFAQDEATLFNKPSKKELYARARDVLKSSLENKDMGKARQALEYLQANTQNGAPLTQDEEYRIYFEIGDYEKAIILFEDLIHPSLDPLYKPKTEQRIQVNDILSQYIAARWQSTSPENHKIKEDSLLNIVNNSETPQQYKDLFTVLIYLDFVDNLIILKNNNYVKPEDSVLVQNFLDKSIEYCSKYPMTGPTVYLNERIIPQIQKRQQEIKAYQKDPERNKYYTGGLSVFVGKWLGFMSGEATDYLDSKMSACMIFEAELQIKRLVLGGFWSYGLETTFKYEEPDRHIYDDESLGLTLGYVAYDSRFLKVTPFIGISTADLMTIDYDIETQFVLGANVDSRLIFKKISQSLLSLGITARFKYMLQIGTYEPYNSIHVGPPEIDSEGRTKYPTSNNVSASMLNHTFALELGIFLW